MIISILPLQIIAVVLGLTANGFKLYHNVPGSEIRPWTSDWYKLCAEHYRSFDHQTGLFTTYDGKKIFCRFKKVER